MNSKFITFFLITATSLTVFLLSFVVYKNTLVALNTWNNSAYLQIFLKKSTPTADTNFLIEELQKQKNVQTVLLKKNEQTLQDFQLNTALTENQLNPEEITELLPETVEVIVSAELNAAEKKEVHSRLIALVEKNPIIDDIVDGSIWFDHFLKIQYFVRAFGVSVLILIVLTLGYLISLILKILLNEANDEIEIYTLLGATKWYLYKYFLIDPIVVILSATAISGLFSYIIYKYMMTALADSLMSQNVIQQFQFSSMTELLTVFALFLFFSFFQIFYTVQKKHQSVNKIS